MRKRFGMETSSPDGFRSGLAHDDRITVMLVCLFCSRVQTISVPREAATVERICWECFSCQRKDRFPFFGIKGERIGNAVEE